MEPPRVYASTPGAPSLSLSWLSSKPKADTDVETAPKLAFERTRANFRLLGTPGGDDPEAPYTLSLFSGAEEAPSFSQSFEGVHAVDAVLMPDGLVVLSLARYRHGFSLMAWSAAGAELWSLQVGGSMVLSDAGSGIVVFASPADAHLPRWDYPSPGSPTLDYQGGVVFGAFEAATGRAIWFAAAGTRYESFGGKLEFDDDGSYGGSFEVVYRDWDPHCGLPGPWRVSVGGR